MLTTIDRSPHTQEAPYVESRARALRLRAGISSSIDLASSSTLHSDRSRLVMNARARDVVGCEPRVRVASRERWIPAGRVQCVWIDSGDAAHTNAWHCAGHLALWIAAALPATSCGAERPSSAHCRRAARRAGYQQPVRCHTDCVTMPLLSSRVSRPPMAISIRLRYWHHSRSPSSEASAPAQHARRRGRTHPGTGVRVIELTAPREGTESIATSRRLTVLRQHVVTSHQAGHAGDAEFRRALEIQADNS